MTTTTYWGTLRALRLANLVAYWRLNEASGTPVIDYSDGTHPGAASAVNWGWTGIGDGNTAGLFNGSSALINVYSAALASDFNGAAGTLLIWVKVSSWAATRYICGFSYNANNTIVLQSSSTNGFVWSYKAGGTASTRVKASTSTTWHCLGLTWDKAAGASGEVKAYYDGVQEGATLTSLGTWTGALASTTTVLGSYYSTPSNTFAGYMAHAALWDAALTPAEMATLGATPLADWIAITDRTAADILARTSKAFFNVADWTRIDANTTRVGAELLAQLGTTVTLTDLTPPSITSFPPVGEINSLIENIDRLRVAASLPAALGVVALDYDYLTGPAATAPDYEDVNAWENDLDLLHTAIPLVADYMVRCGIGNTGQPRFWQARFR